MRLPALFTAVALLLHCATAAGSSPAPVQSPGSTSQRSPLSPGSPNPSPAQLLAQANVGINYGPGDSLSLGPGLLPPLQAQGTQQLVGIAFDGYLTNCTVYLESDGQPGFNPGSDASGLVVNGIWDMFLPLGANPAAAPLGIVLGPGCKDMTFNTTLLLPLGAPPGSSAIASLTTVLQYMAQSPVAGFANTSQAEAALLAALNVTLPPTATITSLDTLALFYVYPDVPHWQQIALAETLVGNVVLHLSALMSPDLGSIPLAAPFVFDALASAMADAAASGTHFDFANTGAVGAVLSAAAASAQVCVPTCARGFVPNNGVVGSDDWLAVGANAVANMQQTISTAATALVPMLEASYVGHTIFVTILLRMASYAANITQPRSASQAAADMAYLQAFSTNTQPATLTVFTQQVQLPGPVMRANVIAPSPSPLSSPTSVAPPVLSAPSSSSPAPGPQSAGALPGSQSEAATASSSPGQAPPKPPPAPLGAKAVVTGYDPFAVAGAVVFSCLVVSLSVLAYINTRRRRQRRREEELLKATQRIREQAAAGGALMQQRELASPPGSGWSQSGGPGLAVGPPGASRWQSEEAASMQVPPHQHPRFSNSQVSQPTRTSFTFSNAGPRASELSVGLPDTVYPHEEPALYPHASTAAMATDLPRQSPPPRRSMQPRWISNDIFGFRSRATSGATDAGATGGQGTMDLPPGEGADPSLWGRNAQMGHGGSLAPNIWRALARTVLQPVFFAQRPQSVDRGEQPEQYHSGSLDLPPGPTARVELAGADVEGGWKEEEHTQFQRTSSHTGSGATSSPSKYRY